MNNPHPKDLSKNPTLAGFFVCGMIGRFGYEMPFLFA